MKIAVLVHAFPVLSETFIVRQIIGLIERGHEVDIFANSADGTGQYHPDIEKYHLLQRTYYRSWIREDYHVNKQRNISLFKTEERDCSYDIVHCHFGPMGVSGAVLREAGLLHGQLITSFYGFDLSSFPLQMEAHVYSHLFSTGDLFIVINGYTEAKAISLGCPPGKIVRLPVGIDLSKYRYQERLPSRSAPIRLLTIGRLVEKKGIEYSIKAVARVTKRHPNLEYLIIGDGPLRNSLESLIDELEIRSVVRLLGWQIETELQKYYASASIFILSSVTAENGDQEGMPLVLQEAQAFGLPVLSTLHSGIPEGVADGESGFLVPERDVSTLTARLNYLVEHPDLWSVFGQAGRRYVELHHNISDLNNRLTDLYSGCLSRK